MNVHETVITAMKDAGLGGYESQALPVIRALQQREDQIVSSLIALATSKGLSPREAEQAIVECGLYVESNTQSEDPRISEMERTIEQMQATLRSLRNE